MRVTVHALFSYNNKIGAKIIANGTHHFAPDLPKVSHTAVLVNGRWVHEATGAGVHIKSYEKWSQEHEEVARVQLDDQDYQNIAERFRLIQDKKYDYLGVSFLGICIIPTFLGFKLPKRNKWESQNKYFCCEVLGYLTGKYYGMSSPIQILASLIQKSK